MLLKVKCRPGAREDKVIRRSPDSFEVWVRAPAERGLANAAVLALLARALGLPAARLRLVKGGRSPSKIVSVFEPKA